MMEIQLHRRGAMLPDAQADLPVVGVIRGGHGLAAPVAVVAELDGGVGGCRRQSERQGDGGEGEQDLSHGCLLGRGCGPALLGSGE